jgi:Tfp pilus assembly protein PilO
MGKSTQPIIAIVVVAAVAIAFWTLALSPKREEADQLAKQAESLSAGIESARSELAQATAARRAFPTAYHQLVELGQAVPSTDETPSLLVELTQIAGETGVQFDSMQLEGEGGEGESSEEILPAEGAGAEASSATEVAASLLPLGASIGSAGLATMPYTLQFKGNFFQIGTFIGRIDSLVKSGRHVAVDGRLLTINGFSLTAGGGGEEAEGEGGEKELEATFSVTTYLTPPGQGITAGASPSAPAEASTQTVAAR